MTYSSLLIHYCQSGTSITTLGPLGEPKLTWSYSTINIPCRFSPITANERIALPGRFDDVKYTVFLESGTKITVDSRVKYGDKYYRVKDMHFNSTYHHRTLLVSEIP